MLIALAFYHVEIKRTWGDMKDIHIAFVFINHQMYIGELCVHF